MNNARYSPTITKRTWDCSDLITAKYEIHDDEIWVSSEVIERPARTLPKECRATINTSASGELTIDQAEAYVEMIQRAIEDAKCR